MKTIYVFLILFVLIGLLFKNDEYQQSFNENEFTILKIDSIKHIYVVYAEKNDSIYKILSKKESCNDCQPIEVGCKYSLKLDSYFLPEEFHIKMRMTGVSYDGVIINIERDSIVSDLFITNNLKGICYIELPTDKE